MVVNSLGQSRTDSHEIIDLSDFTLVVGSGLIALDAVLQLSNVGVKTAFVSSSSRLHSSSAVLFNGEYDSTFLDSHGVGGMAKFWAGQIMRMERIHFNSRPKLGFPEFIDYEEYYQASKLVEKEYGLKSFDELKLPLLHSIFSRRLPKFEYVFSQFVPTDITSHLSMRIKNMGILQLPTMRVMSFENVSNKKVMVNCRDHKGEEIEIICKELLLSAGTVGNTEIVLRSKERFPSKFVDTSPVGKFLVDHPIVDLGSFEVRGSRFLNFKVNQKIYPNMGRIKTKFRPIHSLLDLDSYPDSIIEIAPRVSTGYTGRVTLLRRFHAALNLIFMKFGIDLRMKRRFIDVTLHLEQLPRISNCIELDSENKNLNIKISLSEQDYAAIEKYSSEVERALTYIGYTRVSPVGLSPKKAYHLSGSLRMGNDPSSSVVNLQGEIHGNPDVRVLGLSNLPTTGFTNPSFSALVLNRILLRK